MRFFLKFKSISSPFRLFAVTLATTVGLIAVWLLLLTLFSFSIDVKYLGSVLIVSFFVYGSAYVIWLRKRLYGFTWYPRIIAFSVLAGLLIALSFSWTIAHLSDISPLIFSSQIALIVYMMITMANVFVLVTAIIWFLFNSESDHLDWVISPLWLTYFAVLALLIFFGDEFWINQGISELLLGTCSVLSAYYLHRRPNWIRFSSRFFTLTGGVLFTLGLSFLLLYPAYVSEFDTLSLLLSILLGSYVLFFISRLILHRTIALFESGERLHLRITGSILFASLVVLKTSEWVVFNQLPADSAETILFILFLFICLLVGITFFLSQKVTSPLIAFKNGLAHITAGSFDATIPIQSKDEIGDLAHAYNMMVYRLRDLKNELATTERQAAFSEMARQIAHEIKNPLTPMRLKIQHLQRSFMVRKSHEELTQDVKKITAELIEQVDSLNNIARNFSKYARPVLSEFEIVDINSIISETITIYNHERKVQILKDHSDDPLFCNLPVEECKRVLINLINNSIEAMPGGGVVIIRTYPHKDRAFLEVVDNGEGIAVEDKPKIFTPNFSTKTSGTGLGLAISKKLIESMKGDIQFASAKGAGTTFTLSFPVVQKEE